MELNGFPFHKRTVKRVCSAPTKEIHVYTFETEKEKLRYIVNVEVFPHELYVVKFHLKLHTKYRLKYNLLTNENDARRVIYTCIQIGLRIFEKTPNASFGFIGSPTEKELEQKSLCNTKRFQTYEYFAKFFFSPDNFEHTYNSETSSYLMVNKRVQKKDPKILKKIITMFEENYVIENLLSQ